MEPFQTLADKLEIERATLHETVARYNAQCARGHDADFAKEPQYLRPVRRGPFYAIDTRLHIFTSVGGIKIDHRAQVIDTEGQVIPGLYAVGNCAGGMYASNYELTHPGVALAFAVNSGRIAAENALAYLARR